MANDFLKKHISTTDEELPGQMKGEQNMENAMKYDYAAAIEKELSDMPFMFKSKKVGDETRFDILMPSEKLQGLKVKMIVDEDGDVKLRSYLVNEVDIFKLSVVQDKLNKLNSRYRFICLSLDEDRDLCSAYDFILYGDVGSAVKQAITSLVLFSEITDKCVPELLPLIWKNEEENDRPSTMKTNLFQSEGGVA